MRGAHTHTDSHTDTVHNITSPSSIILDYIYDSLSIRHPYGIENNKYQMIESIIMFGLFFIDTEKREACSLLLIDRYPGK